MTKKRPVLTCAIAHTCHWLLLIDLLHPVDDLLHPVFWWPLLRGCVLLNLVASLVSIEIMLLPKLNLVYLSPHPLVHRLVRGLVPRR